MTQDTRARHYTGDTDELHLRTGVGEQKFTRKEGNETYLGPLKRDAYHGQGDYIARTIFREPWAYEGKFIANTLEGYGTMSYADNKTFSGLYKKNRAFGPGVLTYPDGRQDVGMWSGSQLLRLCNAVGSVDCLSRTPKDRLQAVKYKALVSVTTQKRDIAKEIMQTVTKDPNLLSQSYKLYSRHCKNPDSLLFDRRYFSDDYQDLRSVEEDLFHLQGQKSVDWIPAVDMAMVRASISVHTDREKSRNVDDPTETVLVAWNNQRIMMDMMKHSFIYRKQESPNHLSYSDVLCNRRKVFSSPGEKEAGSVEMLLASERNDLKRILELLRQYRLCVNVMDNRGNTMILRAASRDAHDTIRMLSEIDADINAVNDEGFSALNHTLTRYLALLHGIKYWAKGFMPPLEHDDYTGGKGSKWMEECMMSRGSLLTVGSSNSPRNTAPGGEGSFYLFDLRLVPKSQDKTLIKRTTRQTRHAGNSVRQSRHTGNSVRKTQSQPRNAKTSVKRADEPVLKEKLNEEKLEKLRRLCVVEETISLLLDIGSDVDASLTPAPVWVLALFAGNVRIIERLLNRGVDPNKEITIDKGSLTPLHVIVLAKPLRTFPRIADLLLQYGADPHIRTDPDYWTALWEFLQDIQGPPLRQKEGMNPLHALILRPDPETSEEKHYLEDIGCILSWNTRETEMFYGLTPFALAIAKGNWSITKVLLKCSKIQLNKKFDEFWGNPLTTLMRTQGTSTDPKSYKMLEYLLNYGADPLEVNVCSVGGNVINFVSDLKEQLQRGGFSEGNLSLPKKSIRDPAEDKKRLKAFEAKEALLVRTAKERVEHHIKGVLTRTIIHCMQKKVTDDPKLVDVFSNAMNHIGKWVTFEELPDLFNENLQISEITNGMDLVNGMLVFPELFPKTISDKEKRGTSRKQKRKSKKSNLDQYNSNSEAEEEEVTEDSGEMEFADKINDLKEVAKLHNFNTKTPPEADKNEHPYIVCYECLRRCSDCHLCPSCGLVYFCSAKCNLKDATNQNSKHPCHLVYWGLNPEEWYKHERVSESIRKSKLSKSKISQIQVTESRQSIRTVGNSSKYLVEEEEERKKKRGLKAMFTSVTEEEKHAEIENVQLEEKVKTYDVKSIKGTATKKGKNTEKQTNRKNRQPRKKQASRVKFGKAGKRVGRKSLLEKLQLKKKGQKVTPPPKKGKARSYKEGGTRSSSSETEKKYTRRKDDEDSEKERKLTFCPEIDYEIAGGREGQEVFWEQQDENKYSLEERLQAYLLSLYSFYGNAFDIDDFFPFVTYRHGNLYYKFYKQVQLNEEFVLENYSFN